MSTPIYYYYYYSSVFSEYPPVIKLTIFLVILLLFVSILNVFRFFWVRYKNGLRRRRRSKIKKGYHKILSGVLYFSPRNITAHELQLKYGLKKGLAKWKKEMLTKLILKLKADQTFKEKGGVFNDKNYLTLLEYLGIFKFWENKMSSGNTDKIIKSFRIINQIGAGSITGSVIARSVYHRKAYLRKFARTTFTRFDLHDPYRFLEEGFDKQFNRLNEKRIHYILTELSKEHAVPQLSKWVKNASNINYKCFLIKEIGFFNQQSAAPFLHEIYEESDNIPVQCQIAETLGEIQYENTLELFSKEFGFAAQKLQLSMIKGLEKLKSKNPLDFLCKAYKSTQFSECKVRIVTLIGNYGPTGNHKLLSLSEESKTDFEKNLFDFALN